MTNEVNIHHAAASNYLNASLCVLPAIRSEKRPAIGRWKVFQKRLPTQAELSGWFANRPGRSEKSPDAVCIVCGEVSGNTEMIDFDGGGELFDAWCRTISSDLLSRLVIESSPSGGWHVIYRCESEISGNLKLAQRKDGEKVLTLIETRGEGGLFLCAPTEGYELAQGDLCDLPVLTAEERDILLKAAWALNEYQPPVAQGQRFSAHRGELCATVANNRDLSAHNSHNGQFSAENLNNHDCPSNNGAVGQRTELSAAQAELSAENSHNCDSLAHNSHNGQFSEDNSHNGRFSADNSNNGHHPPHNAERPGDDFNNRGDMRAVLEQFGWLLARGGENEYWRRPEKSSGWSATLKDRVFYVFSSNAAPFEPNTAYSPFSVYTWLNHGGDFEQAARSLRELGYGGDSATDIPTDVDISAIVGACANRTATNPKKRRFIRADQIAIRSPDWLLRGMLERDSTALIFGDPGCGKSFVAMDWACRIATGTPWRGQEVTAGPVGYILGEGQQGFGRRIGAWQEHNGVSMAGAPLYMARAVALPDVAELDSLVQDIDNEIGIPSLVVLDTLARNFGGGDENSTQDMGRFIAACDRIREKYHCTMLIVHHTGHGDKNRARGAMALKAALDVEYRLVQTDLTHLQLTTTKMKDAETPDPFAMDLINIVLPGIVDDYGKPVTSAAIDVVDANIDSIVAQEQDVPLDEFIQNCIEPIDPCSRNQISQRAEHLYGLSRRKVDDLIDAAEEQLCIHPIQTGTLLRYVVHRPGVTGDKARWTAALLAKNLDANAQELADQIGVSKRYVNQIRRQISPSKVGTKWELVGTEFPKNGPSVPTCGDVSDSEE